MASGYGIEFKDLRDEFRSIRDKVISIVMDRSLMSSNWRLNDGLGSDASPLQQPESKEATRSLETTGTQPIIVQNERIESPVSGNVSLQRDNADTDAIDFAGPEPPQKSRKGHKKSRRGCFNCKKRKIKCQETQPSCVNCTNKKLQCTYPAPKTLSALRVSAAYAPTPISSIRLQATPTTFTLTDMRLFHHFLLEAYPHLPVGNDLAWISQVPLIAHHNAYFMHAVLGMAASHLELITGADLSAQALHHKMFAIKGSNQAISSQTDRTGSDGDALLASCYLLAFQSSYMIDGMQEFFQMVRGCSLLNVQLKNENLPMAFFLTEKDHFEFMQERLLDLPTISPELVEGAERSLEACSSELDMSAICAQLHQALTEVIESLRIYSLRSYFKFIIVYQYIIKMDKDDFKRFMDPGNEFAQILLAHFLAIQLIMAPILDREYGSRGRVTPIRYHLK